MPYDQFNFGPEYQDALLACLIQHAPDFTQHFALLRASYFTGAQRVATARAVFDFWREYGLTPQWDIITQVVFDAIARTSEEKDEDSIMAYIRNLRERDTSDYRAISSRVVVWAKRRALWVAIEHASVSFNENKVPDDNFVSFFQDSLRVGEIDEIEDLATAQLEKLPPLIIEGLLHLGSKLVLGGSSKARKTWLLILMALCVASGSEFLGLQCQQTIVLYVNFELDRRFFKKRVAEICKATGIKLQDGFFHHWCLRGKSAPANEIIPSIIAKAKELKAGLVIIDPSYKLLQGRNKDKNDENSATDVGNLLNEFEKLAVEANCAVAFAGHFAKGNAASKEAIDRISGSGVYSRDPDSILTMTQNETKDVLTVESTLRNLPPLEPFCIRWDYPVFELDLDADPSALKQSSGRAGYDDSAWLQHLSEEGKTFSELKALVQGQTGMSGSTFKERLSILMAKGKIMQTKHGYVVGPRGNGDSRKKARSKHYDPTGDEGVSKPKSDL